MTTTTQRLPADARRAEAVEAVVALAGSQNPGSITTAAVAERMQLTQGALFRHFPSKEALWRAVMEWVAARLLERVEGAMASHLAPLSALEAIFMSHVAFVTENPGVPRMLFGELQRAGSTPAKQVVQALLGRYAQHLQQLIARGKSVGEIDPAVDAAAAASLFIGSIQGLVMQALLAGDVARIQPAAPGVFALYRRGIGSGA
ncbi:MAG: TetR/AcrR family transcriptional regulator [Steroidobacteraceae bacterium]